MSHNFLRVAMFLAYGPFLLMLALYVVALVMRCCGRPALLSLLVQRTSEQKPVVRKSDPSHH